MMMCSTPPQYRRVPSIPPSSRLRGPTGIGERRGGRRGIRLSPPPLLAASSLSIARRFFSCLFPLFASQMPVTRPTGLPVPTVTFCDLLGETKHKLDISWSLDLCRGWKCGSFPDGRPCDLHLACALFWANKLYVSPVFLTSIEMPGILYDCLRGTIAERLGIAVLFLVPGQGHSGWNSPEENVRGKPPRKAFQKKYIKSRALFGSKYAVGSLGIFFSFISWFQYIVILTFLSPVRPSSRAKVSFAFFAQNSTSVKNVATIYWGLEKLKGTDLSGQPS